MISSERLLALCRRYLEGELTVPQLARMYNVSHQYVYLVLRGQCRRSDIPDDLFNRISTKHQAGVPETLSEATRAAIREADASVRSLAGLYGVSRDTIRRIRRC